MPLTKGPTPPPVPNVPLAAASCTTTTTEIQGRSVGSKLQRGDTDGLCIAQAQASQIRWLLAARERIRETQAKCEGANPTRNVTRIGPSREAPARHSRKRHRRSLREIAGEFQAMRYSNKPGSPYSASCVKSMVEGPSPLDPPLAAYRLFSAARRSPRDHDARMKRT